MSCVLLPWDSDHFGFKVAKITQPVGDGDLDWCEQNRIRCAYLLVNAESQSEITWAEKNGFQIVDVRVLLDHALNLIVPIVPIVPILDGVRELEPEDCPTLIQASGELFLNSRFFIDINFPQEKSRALFQKWMERSSKKGETQITLVTGKVGHPTGFVTASMGEGAVALIGLFGVLPLYEGTGLGQDLLKAVISWAQKNRARSMQVVTQGRSVAAQRAYQKVGFRTREIGLWFHKWF